MHTEEETAPMYRTVCYTLSVMVPLQFQPPTQAEKSAESSIVFAIESDQVLPIVPAFAPLNLLPQSAALLIGHPCQCQQWPSGLVHLNFCGLQSLTMVRDQYQMWGVRFSGAIALQPSNPAFANPEQPVGLMPSTDRTPLMIYFDQPRQFVQANLVGAKQIIVRGFNRANQCVEEQYLGQSSFLCCPNLDALTRHEVQLWAPEIVRIEIDSEAPFLLHNLLYG